MTARHQPGLSPANGPSLFGKLFWRMGLTMLLAMSCVVIILFLTFRSHVDTLRDRSLNGQAADLARHLTIGADGGLRLKLPPVLAAAYDSDKGAYQFTIVDVAGRLLAASAGLSAPLYKGTAAKDDGIVYFESIDSASGRSLYGASLRTIASERTIEIQVAQGSDHRDVLADTFLDELADEVLWIVPLIFAAILGVTFVSLKHAMRPLEEVSGQAATIGPSTLDRRLPLAGVPAEIRPLVEAVNAALSRLEEGFRNQRRFTADAAHEMRTPITLIKSHLQALNVTEAEALMDDLAGLERVVSQLLKLAQVEDFRIEPEQSADLHDIAHNVSSFLAPAAIAWGKTLALTGAEHVPVHGDADALEVALRNLVENALEHTAAGTEVEINISDTPALRVLDRGPGLPDEDRALMFERFWRKDRHKGMGAGLGLSIVGRIVAAHGARLEAENRPDGGAVFSIVFPQLYP